MIKHQVFVFLSAAAVLVVIVVLMKMASPNTRLIVATQQFKPVMITTNTLKNRLEVLNESNFDLTMLKNSLKKKEYTLADLPPWSSLWTDKIHLCVMFNLNGVQPKKGVTDILISYYTPFFRDITFIFDGANRERPDFLPEFVDFITCDSHVGWYQHKCIRSCMHRGTEETKGYLYIADDMFINLTMMADLPTDKILFTEMEPKSYSWILDPGPNGWGWMWWGPPFNNKDVLKHIIEVMPSEWMEQLKETSGFPDHFKIVATSDLIYVSRKLKPKLTTALDFIVSNSPGRDLFCEIATCLAVDIAAPNEVVIMEYGYLWSGQEKSLEGIDKKANTAHFVHPVKVGVESHRKLWLRYMENQLYNAISTKSHF